MTKIAEGRMVVKRLKLNLPPMRGEAIVREPKADEPKPESKSEPEPQPKP